MPMPNSTLAGPSLEWAFSLPVTILITVFAAFCIIITVGGNLLVLVAFFVERSLRTPTNYLIESLAFTDLLIGLFSMSLYTMYVLLNDYWPLNDTVCNLWLSIDYTACLTSQYTVFFITLDRFCSVKFPTRYREWRTKRLVIGVIIGTWLLPGILFFTTIFGWPSFNSKIIRKKNMCYAQFMDHKTFNIVLTLVYFWFTLIVMIGLYVGIYCVALKLQRKSYKRRLLTNPTRFQNYPMYDMNLESSNHQRNSNALTESENAQGTSNTALTNTTTEENEESCVKKANRFKACRDSRKYHKKMSTTNNHLDIGLTDKGSKKSRDSQIQSEFHSAPAISSDSKKKSKYVPDSSESFYDDESSCSSFMQDKNGHRSFIAPIAEAMTISARQKIFIPKTPKVPMGTQNAVSEAEDPAYPKKDGNRFCFRNFLCMCECCFKNCTTKELISTRQRGHSENRAIKALRTISIIMGAFLVCWTPYHILVLMKSFCSECIPNWAYNISYWLCYMNSPLNPFCYALANVQIKKTLIRLLKCDFRRT